LNKITFNLTASQLEELIDCLPLPDQLPVSQNKHLNVLIQYNDIKAYKKFYGKFFMHKVNYKISLNPGEAAAFYIAFSYI